jgi:C_GCAxxG_C_C family probable redox protein
MKPLKSGNLNPNKVRELAESYISSGKYHCAESVLLALSETLDFPVDLKYVTGFGRGLGGTKCVCGAYSGSVVVLNLLYGADKRTLDPSLVAATNLKLDKAIQQFDERWKQQNKYTCCRLLTKDVVWGSPEHTKHCVKLTGDAAEILYNLIVETNKGQTKPTPAYQIKPTQ